MMQNRNKDLSRAYCRVEAIYKHFTRAKAVGSAAKGWCCVCSSIVLARLTRASRRGILRGPQPTPAARQDPHTGLEGHLRLCLQMTMLTNLRPPRPFTNTVKASSSLVVSLHSLVTYSHQRQQHSPPAAPPTPIHTPVTPLSYVH